MLDQNTDRMWYVIGALVVGAGIILLANKTMPEVFASVGGMMGDVISSTDVYFEEHFPPSVYLPDEVVDQSPTKTYHLTRNDMNLSRAKELSYDSSTNTYTLELSYFEKWSSGFRIKDSANIVVPHGSIFKLEYEVLSEIDMYAQNDINNSTIDGKGKIVYVNDGDDYKNRIGQIRTGATELPEMFAPANEWTKLTMMYRNKNNPQRNPNRLPLLDSTSFGLHVKEDDAPRVIKLRNPTVTIYEPQE